MPEYWTGSASGIEVRALLLLEMALQLTSQDVLSIPHRFSRIGLLLLEHYAQHPAFDRLGVEQRARQLPEGGEVVVLGELVGRIRLDAQPVQRQVRQAAFVDRYRAEITTPQGAMGSGVRVHRCSCQG
jgi:hypothetical protein